MKTVSYRKDNQVLLGVKTDKGILDVAAAVAKYSEFASAPTSAMELIDRGQEGNDLLAKLAVAASGDDALYLAEESLDLEACVPNPSKIICVGLNYRKHADECNLPYPPSPLLFSKFNNTLSGNGDDVKLPENSSQVDYEAELAIVIGKTTKNVSKDEALSYVYGYCNADDLSARDLQMKTSQWLLGKTLDGFAPLGPYLVSADEVPNPNALNIKAFVNGEERQNSNTSDMIFYCDEIISYISEHFTLYPGDVILTGTPEGVIHGYPKEKQVWLKDGDQVTIEIEGLGSLTNTLKK
ncbi:fumarylacetoacetate hydrolase family protein [Ammoniphilus resinae]|uniref:2-keto-4-pentenoate hydratase/2-oxohepta-3-ene-1,7-dioic acid hydratase in catechol pathway n=1 Tax=Ammoniphilus resinae TaxID=861532 RepID=A0ABS4GQZ3_9BACL|nr:fumarylacetoacetate hydrolase family protein [Ammoniphilus resinae]MBP1932684.1 2-keto-4-pentenoate hydratase/2-oxohepta-3-ene-1,7-dioic acid hydratase in catechol pathway [Ammoniphilus resinae]